MSKLVTKTFLFTHLSPMSPIAETYRSLRNNIEHSTASQGVKTILVTSASPREGKTVTVVNLATAYALAGKKVLIVEGNLRRPILHYIFNLQNRKGFADLLTGNYEIGQVIYETFVNGVSVITAGGSERVPSDVLASAHLDMVMNQLRAFYDIVIVDAPAVFGVTDAHLLAKHCDGTLLVINSGNVSQEKALNVKAVLDKMGVRLIGAVLNNDRSVTAKASPYYSAKEAVIN
jgi:capsular exopolysaccharide synthesis family protein